MNSFSKNNLPSLGIIKDIIRIIALKKTNRMDNSKCWAKNMCCNIKEQNKSKACEFFKMIYEIGIMYFVKFIADDHNQINNIIVNDLHSRLTIKEKSVLSKNFYWNNTLNSLSKSDIVKYQSSMLLMNYYNFSRGGIENELINCC
ncbi:hypothetical protein SDC9_177734 [bioreactor metagenome]|uniref:Uncharacterized protein n=1 Tax=bioreactor metagenome TaxID=1076179 RepID=A0A645GTT9_9ZZZZ